ncbi:hypothetical protein RRG08_030528 [Elysia crispata]|uniref:G-protein coupled receptors family 1 profile domain-containing protein n=1 Tax=Elysia crispata TaxID=231223 RepID=A0AAE0YN39_9GAST|nr:hypothetical protein RRG08_030528 [Elysia crispata]
MNIKSHQILEDATPGLSRNSSIIADLPITPLVSYYVYTIVMYVLGVSLTSALAMFGVFSNTVNIIVFYKMGFQETTNINFFSLAINDLMASCGNLLVEIFQSPFMKIDELPQGSLILQTTYLASFVVYSCCGFGALITAVLAMERCLCIVFPLKPWQLSPRLLSVQSYKNRPALRHSYTREAPVFYVQFHRSNFNLLSHSCDFYVHPNLPPQEHTYMARYSSKAT